MTPETFRAECRQFIKVKEIQFLTIATNLIPQSQRSLSRGPETAKKQKNTKINGDWLFKRLSLLAGEGC